MERGVAARTERRAELRRQRGRLPDWLNRTVSQSISWTNVGVGIYPDLVPVPRDRTWWTLLSALDQGGSPMICRRQIRRPAGVSFLPAFGSSVGMPGVCAKSPVRSSLSAPSASRRSSK